MTEKELQSQIDELKFQLQIKEAQLNALTSEINSLHNSRSWKISKPVRVAGKIARKILPRKVKTAIRVFRQGGVKGVCAKISQKLRHDVAMQKNISDEMRASWNRRHDFVLEPLAFGVTFDVCKTQRKYKFPKKIKFSILVPLYNTPRNFLQEMIASCLFQTYENWELCLADGSDAEHGYVQALCEEIAAKDSRIKYKKLEKNGGISENTNECVKMATGDYISLFDHDDLLHPSALFETMRAICEKDAEFVYTDEAVFKSPDLHKITFMNFKPDFAPDYLNGNNYITHFCSFAKGLQESIGLFNSECDGAQDYDFILRLSENTKRISHVPKCLYYWRASPTSTASGAQAKSYTTDAGKTALEQHIARCGIDATVAYGKLPNTYKINYAIKGSPLVSILIPSYEHWQTLKKCVDSIKKLSTYKNYEIIVIENNSKEQVTFDYYDSLKADEKIKIITWEGKFNYSAINNFGFKHAKGDYILLLNNDTEVISPNWIEEMLMFAQRADVGAVGAMLYYPDDKIQHAGVIVGLGGYAAHSHRMWSRGSFGYVGRLSIVQNYSAVTAACVMIPRTVYEKVNGLDETFEVAYNDVDLCLRIRKAGYLIVWTPYAELYHYESKSRGYEDTPEKLKRFAEEKKKLSLRWQQTLSSDPYYNPNLTLDHEDFSVVGKVFPEE